LLKANLLYMEAIVSRTHTAYKYGRQRAFIVGTNYP